MTRRGAQLRDKDVKIPLVITFVRNLQKGRARAVQYGANWYGPRWRVLFLIYQTLFTIRIKKKRFRLS